MRSKRAAASVGAPGTNDRSRGWSMEIVAGAMCSTKRRKASWPPMPSGVTVGPMALRSWSGVWGLSSGGGSIRIRASE